MGITKGRASFSDFKTALINWLWRRYKQMERKVKVKLVTDTSLPGAFTITAETPEEALILRIFCADKSPIIIGSHGGNISENKYHIVIQHREPEKHPA